MTIGIANPTKPYLVVCFGMLSHRVLSEHDTRPEADAALKALRADPEAMIEGAKGYTRKPHKHDFDVRTHDDLNALTRAILDSYPEPWPPDRSY